MRAAGSGGVGLGELSGTQTRPEGAHAAAAALLPRQRRFAEGVALGKPAAAAYRAAGYSAVGRSAEAAASRLLRNGKVAAYIAAILEEATTERVLTHRAYWEALSAIFMGRVSTTRERLKAGRILAGLEGWV